jgi:hypothetical protein
MTTNATDSRPGWEAVLDRLELDLDQAEQLLGSGHPPAAEPWEVPHVEGPIPTHLLPRAHDIQRRQAELKTALHAALGATGRQRAFTDRVTRSRDTGLTPAAYIDLNA